MPIYEYACRNCEEHLEISQSITEPSLQECPACGGDLRKVFSPVGIAFKGSGFYKTDTRKTNASSSGKKPAESSTEGNAAAETSSVASSGESTASGADSGTKSSTTSPTTT